MSIALRPSVAVRQPVVFRRIDPRTYAYARMLAPRQHNFAPCSPDYAQWDAERGTVFYLSDQHDSGFQIFLPGEYGEIRGVFNIGERPGIGADAVRSAIEHGGSCLDCYDGFLPDYYRRFGFVECGRFAFDPTMAPIGWNIRKHGTPDVVFMSLTGEHPGI